MKHRSSHEFALYFPEASRLKAGMPLTITDKRILMRINSVLRLQVDETLILFDPLTHARVVIESMSKKNVEARVLEVSQNVRHIPGVTVALGLLKRDALDEALYNLAELGATDIQLLLTEKVQRKWGGEKERERLERVLIAAAEQSKNYAIPTIHEPISLQAWLAQHRGTIYWCDVDGEPIYQVITPQVVKSASELTVLVGPEGDLSPAEKQLIEPQVARIVLTPTILRSVQAASLITGYIRCLIS